MTMLGQTYSFLTSRKSDKIEEQNFGKIIEKHIDQRQKVDLCQLNLNTDLNHLHSNNELPNALFRGLDANLYDMRSIVEFIDYTIATRYENITKDAKSDYEAYMMTGFQHVLRVIEDLLVTKIESLIQETKTLQSDEVYALIYLIKKMDLYISYIREFYTLISVKEPTYLGKTEKRIKAIEEDILRKNKLISLDPLKRSLIFHPGITQYHRKPKSKELKDVQECRSIFNMFLNDILPS